ncbi:hypothetical protein H0R92_04785 [Treponema sp. OMZ 840]|uniref:hypothetical protein n=1 Tax=Treponema sp. OMZ 840 TaxID=244313 RepID=UPI003D93022E
MKKNHRTDKKFCLFCIIFFVAGIVFLNAQASRKKKVSAEPEIPESAFCRKELIEKWFLQSPEILRQSEPESVQNAVGDYFLVRQEEKDGQMEIIVAPLVMQSVMLTESEGGEAEGQEGSRNLASGGTKTSEIRIETWPKDSPGSWILYKDSLSGKNLRIRYYFVPDSGVYVDFFPGKEKCFADFVIFGATAAGRVSVPVSFNWFYTASFEDVSRLTRYTLPWNYAKVFSYSYDDVKQMTGLIRSLVPALHKAPWFATENASLDFLKWIIDGLVKPLTGGITLYEPLVGSTIKKNDGGDTKLKGSLRTIPDTHYGPLNYIRNLAAAAISARTDIVYYYDTSGADVKTEAFSYYTDASGIPRSTGYAADSGYPAELLKPLFYVLAVTEADRFFLGAVRQSIPASSANGQPIEHQVFTAAAAFFPWFDTSGVFHVSVFESGIEYTLDEFADKYRGCFVSLVRVKASKEFYPDKFE